MKVPFMDIKGLHEPIADEIQAAIKDVIKSCAFAGGPFVETFEQQFAEFCQCKFAIGVGSGTEALWMALLALGIGEGDEVITAPNTFIATAEAISFCGAKPVFVDIDEHSYTINPELIVEAITPRTKAIVPVHIFGQMADMDGLFVVEDACQAHGAGHNRQHAGTIGDAGCFSFYPGKNLGAFGEAGAVTTNNPDLAEKVRALRDHGQHKKNNHAVVGWNGRMDGIQGAVLSVKLKHLKKWNQIRRQNALHYNDLLSDVKEIRIPRVMTHNEHVYHIYSVRVPNQADFIAVLGKREISCGIHYPFPVHTQKAYANLGKGIGSFPVAEQCAREFVSLPMCPQLSVEQIEYVSKEIRGAF
jgi:dTDP-4-amino-4,6-dideoxygalactose transaminase